MSAEIGKPSLANLPYRSGVGAVIFNNDGLVWVGCRLPRPGQDIKDYWQLPQGGIDPGEDPETAVIREVEEETGTNNVEIIDQAPNWINYDLPDDLIGIDGLEFYGQINMLKGGILFADNVVTVSPNYSKEIQTSAFGCGLEGVIQTRLDDLSGLINGVDTEVWSPKSDSFLPANYSTTSLNGKVTCRRELLAKNGFSADYEGPIYGMVCRLAEQKGLDLLLSVRNFFIKNECRLIILGSGDSKYQDALTKLAELHPEKIALSIALDEKASHLIEAGSDFFLMPSIFEPCGLNQMYSQLYGTIPLVSKVGGLVDTVVDIEAEPTKGTGLMFAPRTRDFLKALQASLKLFADKGRMNKIIKTGMKRNFSWKKAAQAYEKLYQTTI
ncbi:MAG: NUDIX domain-containing protein [Opitutaceae bacterium]|nr:NUDIX domain-containing protein [Opitutaceae bacterium]